MSWLYQGFYVHNPLLLWPILALVLFMTVFVAAVVRALRGKDPAKLEHLLQLPLESDGVVTCKGVRHGD